MSECVREKERERSRVDGTYVLVYVHLEGLRSTEEIKKMLLLLLLKSHSSFTHSLTTSLTHYLSLSLSLSLTHTHTLTRWRYFPLSLSVVILRSQQITNHSMSISWPDLTWVSHMPTLKLLWLFKELLLLSLSLTHTHTISLSLWHSLRVWKYEASWCVWVRIVTTQSSSIRSEFRWKASL